MYLSTCWGCSSRNATIDEKCGCGRCTRLPAVEVACNHNMRANNPVSWSTNSRSLGVSVLRPKGSAGGANRAGATRTMPENRHGSTRGSAEYSGQPALSSSAKEQRPQRIVVHILGRRTLNIQLQHNSVIGLQLHQWFVGFGTGKQMDNPILGLMQCLPPPPVEVWECLLDSVPKGFRINTLWGENALQRFVGNLLERTALLTRPFARSLCLAS